MRGLLSPHALLRHRPGRLLFESGVIAVFAQVQVDLVIEIIKRQIEPPRHLIPAQALPQTRRSVAFETAEYIGFKAEELVRSDVDLIERPPALRLPGGCARCSRQTWG
jgi:hypothetical protein